MSTLSDTLPAGVSPPAVGGLPQPHREPTGLRRRLKSAWYGAAPLLFGNPVALALRDRAAAQYLRSADPPRVNVGCGKYPMPGWLNFDLVPRHTGVLHADATRRMPLPDGSVALVRAEHMIEHLPHGAALAFLREVRRVLRPGGRLRLVTPDLARILALMQGTAPGVETDYVAWVTAGRYPQAPAPAPEYAVNAMFRFYGHQFIWSRALLARTMEEAGFTAARFHEVNESDEPLLAGQETHGRFIGEPFNRLESMVLEATRPA